MIENRLYPTDGTKSIFLAGNGGKINFYLFYLIKRTKTITGVPIDFSFTF